MKELKQLGVWMDHSYAYLMEIKENEIVTNCIVSDSLLHDHEKNLNEERKYVDFNDNYKKSKQERAIYFRKISDIVKNYEEVILFGPTDAKNELINIMEADQLLGDIKVEKKNADKMTENEMHALVIEYFRAKKTS